mmetsp:Transcript_8027/g.8252  ORF Transcript_8027/g.8252 Transcript_8027/m.8252 type:complete len:438 (-) Transcript_8027:245-1558(-)
MAMETVVTMAHAMGRTLVLPPEQGMYLLRKGDGKQKTTFSFNDFFHMDSLHLEHDGLDIISMDTFLKRMAMTGRLVNKETSKVEFPPGNRTDWNGLKNDEITKLKEYLRKVTDVRNWKPEQCLAAIPADASLDSINDMKQIHSDLLQENIQPTQFTGNPTPVNAPLKERMSEALNRRKDLCLYDEDMQHASVVHFMCYHKERARLLTHFYGFLFFQDWRQDLWTKRFVRDHLRYVDEVQCAAAAVVRALRDRVKGRVASGGNDEGLFDSVHIRRGDFQFKKTQLSAEKLYEHSRDVLHENATLFIATDERDKAFFKPFADRYDVCFLDDFQHLFPNLNTNFYGMLDQIIASKGEVFVGTFFSTFTGYINRMRGYHIAKYKLPGYEDGTMESYYFVPENKKFVMKSYWPIQSSLFNREYPVAWRDIDQGIGELGYEGE